MDGYAMKAMYDGMNRMGCIGEEKRERSETPTSPPPGKEKGYVRENDFWKSEKGVYTSLAPGFLSRRFMVTVVQTDAHPIPSTRARAFPKYTTTTTTSSAGP